MPRTFALDIGSSETSDSSCASSTAGNAADVSRAIRVRPAHPPQTGNHPDAGRFEAIERKVTQAQILLRVGEKNDLGRAVGDGNGEWFATIDADGRGKLQVADGNDIAPTTPRSFAPTLFLYDHIPGGIGLSTTLYDRRTEVVVRANALVSDCPCVSGCPACVGPILATDAERGHSPKMAALSILALLGNDGGDGAA